MALTPTMAGVAPSGGERRRATVRRSGICIVQWWRVMPSFVQRDGAGEDLERMWRVDPGRGRDQRRFRSDRRVPGRRHNPPVAMPLEHGDLARFHPGGHPLACTRRCGGGTLVAAAHGSRPVPLRSVRSSAISPVVTSTALMAAGLLIAAAVRTGSRRRQRTVMPCNARPGCVGCRRHSQSGRIIVPGTARRVILAAVARARWSNCVRRFGSIDHGSHFARSLGGLP